MANQTSNIGNRIRSARTMAGLSRRELSDRLEGVVSYTALSRYEKGDMIPDSRVLIALSKALGVNTDYLLRPQTIDIKFRDLI